MSSQATVLLLGLEDFLDLCLGLEVKNMFNWLTTVVFQFLFLAVVYVCLIFSNSDKCFQG